ncbi:winged helix-turn-helix domain-containing tetratricopeptide repeat protein [Parvularcula maris]|uniref:Winged helix-turn-helix domain-containing protein n=1 Tax=Parvularcula maris TaxID=2965077 RepID=A0A9X2RKR6_9PROT|nr:winged helix-turn-helix domain-containing protein [Parvularcula maris]MCQ8186063.1 winged helix-turn-helix domain-containing protein [Parvularcula maris]
MVASKADTLLESGELTLDLRDESVLLGGNKAALSPTAFRLLVALMSEPETLQSKEALILKVWDGRAVSDAALTTAIREVRLALSDQPRQPRYIETVHGRGYRFLQPVSSAPRQEAGGPAEPRQSAAPSAPVPASRLKWITALAAVLLLAVTGSFMVSADFLPVDRKSGEAQALRSIAVLPFHTGTTLEEDELFADMVHDDLLTRLAALDGFKTISRTSMLSYRGAAKTTPEVAAELGVDAVLEGTVRRGGDRVRINLTLVSAHDDRPLWAESYERSLEAGDLFDIQAQMGAEIADALTLALSTEEKAELAEAPTVSFDAYAAYFRGKRIFEEALVENWQEDAIAAFEEAIALDPSFVSAWAAKAHVELSRYWYGDGTGRAWVERARQSLEQADAIDPRNIDTLISWGYYHYWGFRDYETAEEKLAEALSLGANRAEAWELRAYVARRRGDFRTAINALKRAHELNPLDIELLTERLETYAPLGYPEEAKAMIQAASNLNPTSLDLINNEARFWWYQGDYEAAWASVNKPVTNPGKFHAVRISQYALLLGEEESFQQSLAGWDEAFAAEAEGRFHRHFLLAEWFVNRGEEKEAQPHLAALDALIADPQFGDGKVWAPNGSVTPVDLPGLRRDAVAVRQKVAEYEALNITDTWQAARHWPPIAKAFVRVGDHGRALDYLEKYTELYGPAGYLRFVNHTAFQPLLEEPRFKALEGTYRRSVTSRG